MTNLERIRNMSEKEMVALLVAATRDDLSIFDICVTYCHECAFAKLCSKWESIRKNAGDEFWKKWLNEEVKEDDEP